MNILIAPNAFKHSSTASKAAEALKKGFLRSNPDYSCTLFPIGDGGDGTAELLIQKLGASMEQATVKDPLGRDIEASFGWLEHNKTAIIEMAVSSGIRLLSATELNPMLVSSYGTGQLILRALDLGASRIILCMGGSATVDGGMGMLHAIGLRFYLGDEELEAIPLHLQHIDRIDTARLDPRIAHTEMVILCDVANKLLGPEGAASVFGPQKGATPDTIPQLETMLGRFRSLAARQTGRDMADLQSGGTAGGAAAGLWAYTQARLVNGIDYFLELTGFESELAHADLVVTGEGSIDLQTLEGKGPYGVARMAKEKGIPVVAIAGSVPMGDQATLRQYFDVLLPIGNAPANLEMAIAQTIDNMERTAYEIGMLLKIR